MEKQRVKTSWVLILTSLGFFMSMMDSMIVTTATTAIKMDFNISMGMLQWVLNAYNITIAAVLLVGVSFGERFGRRKIYNLGLLLFTLGSVLCAMSNNIDFLIFARVVEGVGASVMTPMSMAILSNSLPAEKVGKALGIWSGIGGLALIVGPSLGGFIASQFAWQWIFWINVPIGLIAVYLSKQFLPESLGHADKIRFGDVILIILASSGLIWALSEFTKSSTMGIAVAVGVISILLWIWLLHRQNHAANPMIPTNLFSSKTFTGGNLATLMLYASMYGVVFFLPQFLQAANHEGALQAGLEMLPWTGTLVIVAPFAGGAVDKFGGKLIATFGLVLQGIGYLAIAIILNWQMSYWELVLPLMIAGAGLSMAGPALQKMVVGSVDAKSVGNASGIYNVFRLFGGALGTTIAALIFMWMGSTLSSTMFTNGFQAVMVSSAVISFLGIIFSLRSDRI